ncbi:hypothetical protein B0H14DRAFT_3640700 [Mycena olivaceomarginata]|nr:hypothetical protein B0H14DRAFT_3640700 [Mycena olivaceomarginata]
MILKSTSSQHSKHLRSSSTSTLLENDKDNQSIKLAVGPSVKGDGPSHDRLRVLGFALHLVLVLVHVVLLVIWRVHAEHNIIFAVRLQGIVSFLVTALATTVGTLYLSLLVYITQKFALQRNLQFGRTLTAAHDNATAWIGLGSGLETLFDQIAVPSSSISILLIVGYLLDVSVLHITIPALFSVQAFNISSPQIINTQGFPQLNIPLGVGALYEVLDVNDGQGLVSVPGVGFNITCNSIATNDTVKKNLTIDSQLNPGLEYNTSVWEIIFPDIFTLFDTAPNCFNTRVPQTVEVDCRSRESVSLAPDIRKESAVWRQANSSLMAQNFTVNDHDMTKGHCWSALLNIYYSHNNPNDNNPDDYSLLSEVHYNLNPYDNAFLSLADVQVKSGLLFVYLMEQLGLYVTYDGIPQEQPTQIALHDIENALSSLVASTLWTAHSQKLQITSGLVASFCLSLLALPHLHPDSTEGMKTLVGGTGILHIIWLLRTHPEVGELFPDVGEPTNQNLRAAGMVGIGVGTRDSEENAT